MDSKKTPQELPSLADGFFVSPALNGGWVVHSNPKIFGDVGSCLAAVSNNSDLEKYISENLPNKGAE